MAFECSAHLARHTKRWNGPVECIHSFTPPLPHSPVFVVAVSLRFLQIIINSSIVHSRRPDCCVCVVAILTQSTLTDSDWLVFFLVYSFPEFTAFNKNKRINWTLTMVLKAHDTPSSLAARLSIDSPACSFPPMACNRSSVPGSSVWLLALC